MCYIEGYDNTLTNLRIYNMFTDVDVRSGGNSMAGFPNRFADEDFILGESGSIQKVTLGETLLYR